MSPVAQCATENFSANSPVVPVSRADNLTDDTPIPCPSTAPLALETAPPFWSSHTYDVIIKVVLCNFDSLLMSYGVQNLDHMKMARRHTK